jgi:hypothetical protein
VHSRSGHVRASGPACEAHPSRHLSICIEDLVYDSIHFLMQAFRLMVYPLTNPGISGTIVDEVGTITPRYSVDSTFVRSFLSRTSTQRGPYLSRKDKLASLPLCSTLSSALDTYEPRQARSVTSSMLYTFPFLPIRKPTPRNSFCRKLPRDATSSILPTFAPASNVQNWNRLFRHVT